MEAAEGRGSDSCGFIASLTLLSSGGFLQGKTLLPPPAGPLVPVSSTSSGWNSVTRTRLLPRRAEQIARSRGVPSGRWCWQEHDQQHNKEGAASLWGANP